MRKLPRTRERGSNQFIDAAYAPVVEVFDHMSHQEIHRRVRLLDPPVLTAGQQAWRGAASGLGEAVEQANAEIRTAIADGWRGPAAASAAAAVQSFEQTGRELADVLAAVAQRLGQASDAAEAVRAAVPAPSGAPPDLGAALLDPARATANTAAQQAAENARQDVVRAMDTIYLGAFIPSGTGVPAFPDDTPGAAGEPPVTDAPGTGLPGSPRVAPETPVLQAVSAVAPVSADAVPRTGAEEAPGDTGEISYSESAAPATTLTTAPGVPHAGAPLPQPPAETVAAATEVPVTAAAAAGPQQMSPGQPAAAATVAASAAPVLAPTVANTGGNDDKRKREERPSNPGADAATGLGAGAMGGMIGGAMAAADTPRSGPSVAAAHASHTARAARRDDDDDDLHFFDDDPTYLEPADESGELIGALDPTTPPVLGEWIDLE